MVGVSTLPLHPKGSSRIAAVGSHGGIVSLVSDECTAFGYQCWQIVDGFEFSDFQN